MREAGDGRGEGVMREGGNERGGEGDERGG